MLLKRLGAFTAFGADLFFVRQQPPKAGAPSPGEQRIRCAENRAHPEQGPIPGTYALGPIVFVDPPHRVEAIGHGRANRNARLTAIFDRISCTFETRLVGQKQAELRSAD